MTRYYISPPKKNRNRKNCGRTPTKKSKAQLDYKLMNIKIDCVLDREAYLLNKRNLTNLQKGDLWIIKNNRGITFLLLVDNAKLLTRTRPDIKNILRKNRNSYRRNQLTILLILTIYRIIEVVRAKTPEANYYCS